MKPQIYQVAEDCLFGSIDEAMTHDEVGPWGPFVAYERYRELLAEAKKLAEALNGILSVGISFGGSCRPGCDCNICFANKSLADWQEFIKKLDGDE